MNVEEMIIMWAQTVNIYYKMMNLKLDQTLKMVKSLATSVTMLVNQTKDNLLRVQAEIRNLSTTVDTLATEMKEDCQA